MYRESLLLEFLNGFDPSKHLKMMEVYVTGIEGHMETCSNATAERDHMRLKNSVHNVKSLCRTLGAQEAGELAYGMEQYIIDGQEDQAFEQTGTLLEQLEDIKAVISQRLAQSA